MTSRFGREEQLRRLCILVVDRESSLMLASMIENEMMKLVWKTSSASLTKGW